MLPVCGKKKDRIEGDDCNRDVRPAPAAHIFVIERNDHVNVSRSKLPSSQDTIRRRAGALILGFILAGPLERKPVLPSQFVYWLMLNPLEIGLSCTIKVLLLKMDYCFPAQSVSR